MPNGRICKFLKCNFTLSQQKYFYKQNRSTNFFTIWLAPVPWPPFHLHLPQIHWSLYHLVCQAGLYFFVWRKLYKRWITLTILLLCPSGKSLYNIFLVFLKQIRFWRPSALMFRPLRFSWSPVYVALERLLWWPALPVNWKKTIHGS